MVKVDVANIWVRMEYTGIRHLATEINIEWDNWMSMEDVRLK
jgi:hypothetical protein